MNRNWYKVKNPVVRFFCPLCGIQRGLKYSSRLDLKNYIQILVSSIVALSILFPLIGAKSLLAFFFIWGGFEFFQKFNFRREVPCPNCGFDATWYRKDVKIARQRVKEFFENKEGKTPIKAAKKSDASKVSIHEPRESIADQLIAENKLNRESPESFRQF